MSTQQLSDRAVRVLVAEVQGSAPREAGAAMLVGAGATHGTIGGGALELAAIQAARGLLAQPDWHRELRSYPLGPGLGQCCGGRVRLLFETLPRLHAPSGGPGNGLVVRAIEASAPPVVASERTHAADWPLPVLRAVRQMLSGTRPRETVLIGGGKGLPAYVIEPEARPLHSLYLYGAGHVGRAVVRALEGLPFAIVWVDVAADRFPDPVPANAAAVAATDPATVAATAPAGALHLVMTFSHAIDLGVTAAVLARPFAFAGLIGSATKRARFEARLRQAAVPEAVLRRLVCPIGIGDIRGKEPAMIAISVAAQLAAWACEEQAAPARADTEKAGS